MATGTQKPSVEAAVPADIPDTRAYSRPEDAELDRAMVDAIRAADQAGNDFLSRLLALELGSHYYETR